MSYIPSWKSSINQVSDGQHISADNANRAAKDLAARTDFLRYRIDAHDLAQATYQFDAPLDSSVVPNRVVAFNPGSGKFELALAEISGNNLQAQVSHRAIPYGVCVSKDTETLGVIVTGGLSNKIDPSALIAGGDVSPGQYYLSSTEPGKVQKIRPPFGVPVCYIPNDSSVLVRPMFKDLLDTHRHFKFLLSDEAAGSASEDNGTVTIGSPDPDLSGWLPADHASFGGLAPDGAKFGYNISQHPELQDAFPPIPIGGSVVTLGGKIVSDSDVVVDEFGIWWFDDDEDNTPFFGDPGETVLWFAVMTTLTDQAVVTCLTAGENSGITIVDKDGNPAKSGSLVLNADFSPENLDDDEEGHLVVKDFDGINYKRGPVVSKLSAEAPLTVDQEQGEVTISLDQALMNLRVGTPDLYYNDDVRFDTWNSTPFLHFPAGKISSLQGRIKIPPELPNADSYQVTLKLQILAVHPAGTLTIDDLKMGYRVLPEGPDSLPTSQYAVNTGLNIDSSMGSYAYKVVDLVPIPVEAGDILLFTLKREDNVYAGGVGLLSVTYVIEAVS